MTHLERLAVAEDQEVRRAIDTRGGGQKRRRSRIMPTVGEDHSSDSDSATSFNNSGEMSEGGSSWAGIAGSDDDARSDSVPPRAVPPASIGSTPQVGSALRRNPDGSVIAPKVVPRRPKPVLGRKVRR